MRCLYCGKEIGAFRTLRDSEFCSALHRKKYGERLGKALHDIAAPAPAPAGIAGFLLRMPLQPGRHASTAYLREPDSRDFIRTSFGWPFAIAANETPGEPVEIEAPPTSKRWMSTPAAEPVEAIAQVSAALTPVGQTIVSCGLSTNPLTDHTNRSSVLPSALWMPTLVADPVEAIRQASAALTPVGQTIAFCRLSTDPLTGDTNRSSVLPSALWMPTPAAEPVEAIAQVSAALTPVGQTIAFCGLSTDPLTGSKNHFVGRTPWSARVPLDPLPARSVEADEGVGRGPGGPPHKASLGSSWTFAGGTPIPTDDTNRSSLLPSALWMPTPAAEPVETIAQASAALTPVGQTIASCGLSTDPLTDDTNRSSVLPSALWMPTPAAEPVETIVQASAALAPARTSRTPQFLAELQLTALHDSSPAPKITANLESPAAPERRFEEPAMCPQWMPAPGAEPVWRYLTVSHAPAVAVSTQAVSTHAKLPDFDLSIAALHLPRIAQPQSLPLAEPTLTDVRPSMADVPAILVHRETEIAIPAVPAPAAQGLVSATPAATDGPEAAESFLVATRAALPVSVEHAPDCSLRFAPKVPRPAPAAGGPVDGASPAALESRLAASQAANMAPAAALRMLPFAIAADQKRTVAGFDAQYLAAPASIPGAAAYQPAAPQPIATLSVALPAHSRPRLESGLPHPGLLPIEFHTRRPNGVAAARPERILSRLAVQPPKFPLRALLDKLEEAAPPANIAPKKPSRVLNMPARRPPSVTLIAFRVAAGFLLAVTIWYGLVNRRSELRLATAEENFPGDTAIPGASSAVAAPNAPAPAEPKGAVAWARQAIANRAAVKLAESFRGMENWDRGAKGETAGWSRHPDGYMNTGALALYRPTLKFTDYRMEFFGQIETKSIGWTVRAADKSNYHAMKLSVVEAGMRPFVALVHYNVVNGKSGHRTVTPLNVMVHNNRPMQFAIDVQGSRMVTSIDGEEVDSFIDATLTAGGVGFFSDPGERARLYWMRVARNDDWLGRVCTMLADVAGVETSAALRAPAIPGDAPVPGFPGDADGRTLAAVAILPSLRGTRKTRFIQTWRSQPWNT